MASRDGISGTLLSVDTDKREITLEVQVFAFEAEPASDFKSYTYDLGDDWDDERVRGAVGERRWSARWWREWSGSCTCHEQLRHRPQRLAHARSVSLDRRRTIRTGSSKT